MLNTITLASTLSGLFQYREGGRSASQMRHCHKGTVGRSPHTTRHRTRFSRGLHVDQPITPSTLKMESKFDSTVAAALASFCGAATPQLTAAHPT